MFMNFETVYRLAVYAPSFKGDHIALSGIWFNMHEPAPRGRISYGHPGGAKPAKKPAKTNTSL